MLKYRTLKYMILKYQTERNCIDKKSVKKQKNITNREYQSEKKMKKLFLMILTAVLAFSLCGCQANGNIKNRSFLDEETPPETEKTDKSGGKTGIKIPGRTISISEFYGLRLKLKRGNITGNFLTT